MGASISYLTQQWSEDAQTGYYNQTGSTHSAQQLQTNPIYPRYVLLGAQYLEREFNGFGRPIVIEINKAIKEFTNHMDSIKFLDQLYGVHQQYSIHYKIHLPLLDYVCTWNSKHRNITPAGLDSIGYSTDDICIAINTYTAQLKQFFEKDKALFSL